MKMELQVGRNRTSGSLFDRQVYNLDFDRFWQENRTVLLISLFCFLGALLYRSWPNFLHPSLYVEDNTHYFSYFYGNHHDFSALLHNTNGYHNIFNNLIGLLVAKFDVRWQPTLYMLTGTTFAVLAVMALPVSGLLKNKYLLIAAPLLLGLSGLNHLFYYVTLTYQLYVLIILLLTMLFWQPLKGIFGNVLLFLFLSFLIWSGPYSVLVVPFSFCFILFFRGKTVMLLLLSLVTIFYTLTVTEHMILLRNLLKPEIYLIWTDVLFSKVFFMGMHGGIGPKKVLLVLGFFFIVLTLLRRDTFYLKVACLFFVLINSGLAALFLSKKFMISLRILPCYLVISQYFWLLFLLFTADRLLGMRKVLTHGGLLVLALAVFFVVVDNRTHPDKGRLPIQTGLPDFLNLVHQKEAELADTKDRALILEYGTDRFHPVVRIGRFGDPSIQVEHIHVKASE